MRSRMSQFDTPDQQHIYITFVSILVCDDAAHGLTDFQMSFVSGPRCVADAGCFCVARDRFILVVACNLIFSIQQDILRFISSTWPVNIICILPLLLDFAYSVRLVRPTQSSREGELTVAA